ncbi:ABC-2 type transport system permease protein [Scopulibacillus darangshiensis]|uniref:ABC-2 type transport system permease protein n=1 Tax=Scopulibacillus darangshiensis TaxID=442528 RepID=A0A4R2P9M6_9BACL|nr:ABC transporter permease subunit [Scopulibacillus darangshiensis]TCP30924.1 ABC-2 type transport system permease protein [Scopulibacillus darangshiensis]
MIHILKREFTDSIKSIRAILIILFITFVSYKSALFLKENPFLISELGKEGIKAGDVYSAGLSLIVFIFGFLFVFAISHDIVNSETEMKTMRLLVTKTSRPQVMFGKLLGATLFWVVTISVSYAIISLISQVWNGEEYLRTLIFLFYIICLAVFISTIVPKTKLTMFLGILLGIALPILGSVSMIIDKWYLVPFKYILPFYYLDQSFGYVLIPLAIGIIFFLMSVLIMERRDL